MPIGSAVALNDQLRPREQELVRQLREARVRVREAMLVDDLGPDSGVRSDSPFDEWLRIRDRLTEALATTVAARECDECKDGHLHDCEALEPCDDLYDVLWRYNCGGCCPNGCRERGLQLLATQTGRKLHRMLDADDGC